MAEKVLFSIATGITQILGSLAKEELVLLLGVGDELEKLKNTVSTIEAVLLDAEKQQHGSHAVKTWLAQLEDILYDADDLLDDISTEALQREVMKDKKGKKVRMIFSKPKQLAYSFKIGHQIKAIRNRLDAVAANRTFHLQEGRVEAHVRDRERDDTYSFVRTEDVIGRDDDKEAVIRLLKCSNVEDKDLELKSLDAMKDISDCSDNGDIYELPSSSSYHHHHHHHPYHFSHHWRNSNLSFCGNVEWCWLRRGFVWRD